MTVKNSIRWMIPALILTLTISGCAGFGAKKIEVSSKPIEIEIIQPSMPRNIDLKEPVWHVVSTAKIANPCVKDAEGKRPKMDHPDGLLKENGKPVRVCELGKENDWPEGYTYLDRFLDDMKTQNNGEILFVATTVGDYKVMAEDMQELKRYIKQLGEVVVYYRNVTIKNSDGTTEQAVGVSNTNDESKRPTIGLFPRDKD